ncbi:MAG: acetyl-CoA acetyltransferase [Caballeronia sp.]|jgi:acetyl-CoA C-acetyltransferase|uniref:acetyl-CoA C-acetyltransferase n=1 Tax=Caballeronia sp. TaxID=1931223 RepID=UPI00261A9B4C|nr:acetyl-CoA C-acetyltransferase [Caballeronia sp.]MDB5837700.1 acetyl-CoA acetyltransferase [Caballeronia sp.]
MRRAAIVAPVRTAVGTFGGALRPIAVETLAGTVINATLARAGIDPSAVEDVVFAQSYANSETPCIGRWAALAAGLPVEVPGMQLDRRCGGGLQAIVTAAMMVQSGAADVVIAGGVESMSNIEYYTTDMRWGRRAGSTRLHDRLERGRERSQPEERFGYISGMIETAENLARTYGISREAADAYAVQSHQRATAAWKAGLFADEVVPVLVPQRKGEPISFDRDEGFRPDASLETLSKLKPLNKDGTVTAGNSSQQNDAAAACLIVAEDRLEALGLKPAGFLVGWAAAGCEPSTMGIGPVPAVRKLLTKTGLTLNQMDLIELNEAFACQVLAVLKGWGWDDQARLNVNGSGISLGHPIGATGVRIMTTLLHEMQRRGVRYGLETMCIGGGQGLAAIFERG